MNHHTTRDSMYDIFSFILVLVLKLFSVNSALYIVIKVLNLILCFRLPGAGECSDGAQAAFSGPHVAGRGDVRATRPVWGTAAADASTAEHRLAHGGAAPARSAPGRSQHGQPAAGDAARRVSLRYLDA